MYLIMTKLYVSFFNKKKERLRLCNHRVKIQEDFAWYFLDGNVNVWTSQKCEVLVILKGKFSSGTKFHIIFKPLGNYDIQNKV